MHAALVDLVNKAHRMQPPPTVQPNNQQFDRFYQAYVTALISLHELYTMTQQRGIHAEFEAHIAHFKKQLLACFVLQREFANCHGFMLWRQLREHQIRKMTHYGYEDKSFLDSALSFYAHMLYNLGVLAARIQGFSYELRSNKQLSGRVIGTGNGLRPAELVKPLLAMVYQMADVLLSDSIICLEPSQNPILVTNNLFPMKIVSLCRFSFFRDFSLQIVSEEVAQQIQQEMRHRKTFDPPSPIRKTVTAALLAMKPATGVKRNNAKASEEGGNTAHKKSDVNSREWISIPPLYDMELGGWCATYPHLLCTTRQKETILETRSAMQTGKRPLFYFHVRADLFSFSGGFSTAHTLSLPFTIATRRNQDCQVQRMMSSYTATCFWLYGTNVLDGLLIQWFDGEIDWKHFKLLYSLYFAMNAEVMRTFTDEDFTILQQKMHCPECTEGAGSVDPLLGSQPQQLQHQPLLDRISFKNVLCPHLHFNAAKCDLRFSVWRGMLELLHLFNDQKTETRNLWESGLLLGFLELKIVHSMLRTLPGSGLVMRLSMVAGACVCFTVKCSNGELLDLEPLDVKRLQAKNLHDYLKDIILAEKVDFVLDSNKEWIHVAEVIKRCQKCAASTDQPPNHPRTREVLSNALHPGPVELEHKITFTTMRIAVVTCKPNNADNSNEPDDEFAEHTKPEPEHNFEQQLEELLRSHDKTPEQAMDILARLANSRKQFQQQQQQQQQQLPHIYEQQPSSQQACSSSAPTPASSSSSACHFLSVPLSDGNNTSMAVANSASNPTTSSSNNINNCCVVPCTSSIPSSFSSSTAAFGSSLEDSYPESSSAHQQQRQQTPQQQQQQLQSFYFTNASMPMTSSSSNSSAMNSATTMPTMNMPIVVMPTTSQASPSFMFFPAPGASLHSSQDMHQQIKQQIGNATIMAIGSLGSTAGTEAGSSSSNFSTSTTGNNAAYAQSMSTALHFSGVHPATVQRFAFPAASSPQFENHQQQKFFTFGTSPTIAILNQVQQQQQQQQISENTSGDGQQSQEVVATSQQHTHQQHAHQTQQQQAQQQAQQYHPQM